MSKVSILIPTFERPKLLERAIRSVLDQTMRDLNVMVFDNASSAATGTLVRRLMAQDSRILYHRHPQNIGMMPNYLFAMAQVQAPYFLLLSDDDFIFPWFLSEAMEQYAKYPDIAFCACSTIVVDENAKPQADPLGGWARHGYFTCPEGALQLTQGFLLPPGIIFHTERARKILPDTRPVIQSRWDSDFILRMAAQSTFVASARPCAAYLSHADGFSTAFFSQAQSDGKAMEEYGMAMAAMLENVREKVDLPAHQKTRILQSLTQTFHMEILYYIGRMVKTWNPPAIVGYTNQLKKLGPLSRRERLFALLANLAVSLPWLGFLWRLMFLGIRVLVLLKRPRVLLRRAFFARGVTWQQEARENPNYKELFDWLSDRSADYIGARTG